MPPEGPPSSVPPPAAARTDADLNQTQMLLDLTRRVAVFETLDEILYALVAVTTRELDAERSTIFLNDPDTGELYSRVAEGDLSHEIRLLNDTGIAGHVFQSGAGVIVEDAYSDPRFNRDVDERTGYRTRSVLCAPIRTFRDEVIGVAQALNKRRGGFTPADLSLLEAMTLQASLALQSTQFIERLQRKHRREMEFVDVVSDLTSEIDLGVLLRRVMAEATRMLDCDRSTLFLNDDKTKELFSLVGEGLGATEIRFPNAVGIAGTVFTSGQTVNIPHAYADLRFNPAFDRQTGFFTRSILCVPVVNKNGRTIGVTQALNKRGGPFTREDEARLKAFTAQVAIALENAKLFDDVQNIRRYNESILASMSTGVVTLDEEGRVASCNPAALTILDAAADDLLQRHHTEVFTGPNAWVGARVQRVAHTGATDIAMDTDLHCGGRRVSLNLTVKPLVSTDRSNLGSLLMIEDISSEKRVKTTMARYMDPGLADQVLAAGEGLLEGTSTQATVLFSDIRGFTPLTEELGAHATVSLLNDYFTIMVECVQRHGGMLDKFIGDALMAAFGIPITHDDDEDRAVKTAIAMIRELDAWNATRRQAAQRPVQIGIGVHTDTVVSGNIGSPKRMDYTLIGDGVNLAARLESACKQYAARILISEHTMRRLRGTYRLREIDTVVVKGQSAPVGVWEVLDYHTEESFPNAMTAINTFAEALGRYRARDWPAAEAAFQAALDLNPTDRLCHIYLERCRVLRERPPEPDWNGVWVMQDK